MRSALHENIEIVEALRTQLYDVAKTRLAKPRLHDHGSSRGIMLDKAESLNDVQAAVNGQLRCQKEPSASFLTMNTTIWSFSTVH